jgi:hypothetical protein
MNQQILEKYLWGAAITLRGTIEEIRKVGSWEEKSGELLKRGQ